MKERGILYSAPMVRAKLAVTKTQTRRIIDRVRGFAGKIRQFEQSTTPGYDFCFRDRRGLWQDYRLADLLKLCPYGQPGDRLWGRETWFDDLDGMRTSTDGREHVYYRADGEAMEQFEDYTGLKWRPSIFMPRWASRILDEIIEIRIERVQDISYDDCLAEGWHPACGVGADFWYEELWGDINGPGSWAANPWVWVIVTKPILPAPK